MRRRRVRRAGPDQAPNSVPCRGQGWRDGECEFFCRRKGAEECVLRNVPRETPPVVTILDVLRAMRWGGRGRGRR